jgi:hypothetical protein
MPFASRAQQRAAFAGAIPGFSKKRARQWAKETDFDSLPEKAKKAYGATSHAHPGIAKDVALSAKAESDRQKEKSSMPEEFVKLCAMILARPPRAPVSKSRLIGRFTGKTPKVVPGPAARSMAINPGKNPVNAVTPSTTSAVGSPGAPRL